MSGVELAASHPKGAAALEDAERIAVAGAAAVTFELQAGWVAMESRHRQSKREQTGQPEGQDAGN
jgi:hypothetical protein